MASRPVENSDDEVNEENEPLDGSFLVVESQVEVTSTPIKKSQGKDDTQPSKKFKCDVCNKEYSHKWSLKRHLMQHMDRPKCSACHHYFKTDEELLKHNETKHSHTFLCSDCGVSCKRKSDLNYHLASMHGTGSLPTKACPFDNCTKTFAKERRYQDHINKHIGVKAHVCKSCSKSFYSSAYLGEHYKSCSKEVSFKCPICNQIFSYKTALNAHKRAEHDGIRHFCQCGRSYKHATSLARHKAYCQ